MDIINSNEKFSTQKILELACSAQRTNGTYIKENDWFSNTNLIPNKILILHTLNLVRFNVMPPKHLRILPEDIQLAEEIRKFYRRLTFTVIDNDDGNNHFPTEVNLIFNKDEITKSEVGYLACLPSLYPRSAADSKIKKYAALCEDGYLGAIGEELWDKDGEILEVTRSKNFDAWNITAVIENMMASWLSSKELSVGPCVIVRSKIKDLSKHWKYNNPVTRLHYVRAAQ